MSNTFDESVCFWSRNRAYEWSWAQRSKGRGGGGGEPLKKRDKTVGNKSFWSRELITQLNSPKLTLSRFILQQADSSCSSGAGAVHGALLKGTTAAIWGGNEMYFSVHGYCKSFTSIVPSIPQVADNFFQVSEQLLKVSSSSCCFYIMNCFSSWRVLVPFILIGFII